MSTAANQDLSLAKLKRSVSSSIDDYTTESSMREIAGVGSDINTMVSDFGTTHPLAPTISTDNVIISKGYADDTYVNVDGDEMTGLLSYDTGVPVAQGREIPAMEDVISRAGSEENRTMLDTLFLSDHPNPLQGQGTPNGPDDLQAVTKFYVDTQGFASTTNIYVSTSGDDSQRTTPPGQEGRSPQYAFKTINKAMVRATEIIESTPFEPGPYVQTVTFNNGDNDSLTTAIGGVISPVATSDLAAAIVDANTLRIQDDVVEHINITFPNLVYSEDLCRRDVGLILQSVKLDVQAGGNYLSRWAGKRYSANPSAVKARSTQYTETVAGINKARSLILADLVAAGTISSAVQTAYGARFDDVITFLDDSLSNDAALIVGNSYAFEFSNGSNPAVDQGVAGNPDLREGKIIRGVTSRATGIITDYQRAFTATTDKITVELKEPIEFIAGEKLEFGAITQNNQITVRVESGIYDEHLPIKLPENVSIKGDEFRRAVIRPKLGVSQSVWANTYFYRDVDIDGLAAAESPIATLSITSGADASRAAGVYNISASDYATSGIGEDATFEITVDGTGAVTVANVVAGGQGFIIGEIITIPDSNVGGGGAADVTLSVTTTGGGFTFVHPVTSKNGKYGYHYAQDSSTAVDVGTDGATNPGNFPEGARLILLNKEFIAEEVIQYIDAQVLAGIGIWSGFTYDAAKCRRDTRLIIDGIVSDLKNPNGGREATLTNQGAYFEGSVAGQEAQTVEAINYTKTIVTNIVNT